MISNASDFFDARAESWDAGLDPVDFHVIPQILARAQVDSQDSVLDIGAGTGILVPFLQALQVKRYLGVDSSAGMARVFRRKFPDWPLVVADFERDEIVTPHFSLVIIFNAFPHFLERDAVLRRCFQSLAPGGRCVVGHSLNRQALNALHQRKGGAVSDHMLPDDAHLLGHFSAAGFVESVVDDGDYFFAMGVRPTREPRPASPETA